MSSTIEFLLKQQAVMWAAAEDLHQNALQEGAMLFQKIRDIVADDPQKEVLEREWQKLLSSIRAAEARLKPPLIGFGLEILLKEWVSSQSSYVGLIFESDVEMEQEKLGVFYHIFQQVIKALPNDHYNLSINVTEANSSNKIYFKLLEGEFKSNEIENLEYWRSLINEIGNIQLNCSAITLIL